MILDKHIRIIFENIKLENNIDFFNLWNETSSKIYPNTKLNLNDPLIALRINKNFHLIKYFISIKNLEGDILECGVFKGFSSLLIRLLDEKISKNKNNYFLIDSFEGLSEILDEDKTSNDNAGLINKGKLKADFETVENLFKNYDNVNVIRGWIPQVFELLDNKNKYKFVHLDVDLYQPTLDSLKYVYKKVVKGGIIITDDYKSKLFPGNQKAWETFFNSIKINHWISLPTGQAVFIKE